MSRPTFPGGADDWRSASTGDSTITVDRPPNTQGGDLLLLSVHPWNGGGSSVTTAAGTTATKVGQAGDATSTRPQVAVFYRRVAEDIGEEPDDYTFEGFDAFSTRAFAVRITGSREADPVPLFSGTDSGGTSVDEITVPSDTTDLSEPLRVSFGGHRTSSTATYTPGTKVGESGGASFAWDDGITAAGATGTVLIDFGESADTAAAAFVLVAPAEAGLTPAHQFTISRPLG